MLLTEEQIERKVETATDALDARLLSGYYSQADYDKATAALDKWADAQYKHMRKGRDAVT